MTDKAMLTMESRIHGDMYVRFGGRFLKTYRRKAARRRVPSLLKEIADICGIEKNLTFHLARHTFGTLMMTVGADLYTTCKLMGHSDVRTTQIYAKIVDCKKIEAVNLVDRMFEKQDN